MTMPNWGSNISAGILQPQPLERAQTLPSCWYTQPDYHTGDLSWVISAQWQLVGHTSRLSTPGDHLVAQIANNPVMVVRGKEGQLNGFHNVCRHRGGPLAIEDGHCNVLRCRYHGWSYDLNGKLIGTPEFDGVQDFDPEAYGLPPVTVDTWEGFVFASLSDTAPPLAEVMAGISERIAPIELSKFRFATRVEYDIACNWKVYVDNYLEGYHINAVHPELAELLDYRNYVTETAPYYSLQHSPFRADAENNVYSASNQGQAFYYFVYPNLMLNIMPRRLQTNLIVPLAHNRTRVIFDYYYDVAAGEDIDAMIREDLAYSELIQQQDIDICLQVQKGLESVSYDRGRFSVKRELGVHHFQELVKTAYRNGLESRQKSAPDLISQQ